MRTDPHEARVCSFVPPFILESIVQNGTGEEQQAAAATLLVDSSVRIAREVADAANRSAEEGTAAPTKNRRVSSAKNGTELPGPCNVARAIPPPEKRQSMKPTTGWAAPSICSGKSSDEIPLTITAWTSTPPCIMANNITTPFGTAREWCLATVTA